MSSTDPATRRALLRDVFGRLLDGKHLSGQTYMQAYTSVFEWLLFSDDVKLYGRRLLEIFEACPHDYATRISTPFIREAVALYHEKAKTLVGHDAFQARKTEILEMETRRAEVYLHEPHRSDYVNDAEARDVPKLAPTAGALMKIGGVCDYLNRCPLRKQGLEEVAAFVARTFRETAMEKVLSDPQMLSDWLQGALEGVRQGTEPSDEVKLYGPRLLEIFEVRPDACATRISTPFIREAIALYHEKAKTLVGHDAFQARKTEILEMETRRAEVYLHEPHRSDYVATIAELFGLGDETFQLP